MRFTYHALQRGVEMALDPGAIRDAFTSPSEVRSAPGGCVKKIRDRIALVVDPETDEVVTILWNTPGRFDRNDLTLCRD